MVEDMHDELKERLKKLENNYNGKEFLSIVNKVKKDRTSDDELLTQIENISHKRFREKVSITLGLFAGNLLEMFATIAAIVLVFLVDNDWMPYISTLIQMTTLHPLSHYLTGRLFGIRFTHYYLNGPARIEPTVTSFIKSRIKSG